MVTNCSDEILLNLNILFENPFKDNFNIYHLNALILRALQDLYGQVGGAIHVEVDAYEILRPNEYTAMIKLPKRELVKVWSALTLLGSYNSNKCSITIHN